MAKLTEEQKAFWNRAFEETRQRHQELRKQSTLKPKQGEETKKESFESEPAPKPGGNSLLFRNPGDHDRLMEQIKRQNEAPSKAFPGWDPSKGIPPALQEHIEISMFGRVLREDERRAGKLIPEDKETP